MTRQNFYARRKQRRRREVDGELIGELVKQERRIQPRLGVRKLRVVLGEQLEEAGVSVGRDRWFEELREQGLLVAPRRATHARTTNSRHAMGVFTNQFEDLEIDGPHQAWVSDLTYLRSEEGFLYLALVTDHGSRKIVGYHCADSLEAVGCLRALDQAIAQLPPGVRPMHHSDRGSQYCCREYVGRLREHGISISMSEINHCAENALAERINGILKVEYALDQRFATKKQARVAVEQAVHLYNTRRPHTSLAMRCPQEIHAMAA